MTDVMFNDKLAQCPVCGQGMEKGFSPRNMGLSWIAPEKLRQFIFLDEDLVNSGLKKLLPARAEYDLTYRCPQCQIYVVDYSRAVSAEEARGLAEALLANQRIVTGNPPVPKPTRLADEDQDGNKG